MTARKLEPLKTKPFIPGRDGIVYFLQAGLDGPIKIGFTHRSPLSRMAYYQCASHEELRWIGFLRGKMRDELTLHAHFKEYNIRYEWFRPADEIKAFIEEKCPNFDVKEAIVELIKAEVRRELLDGFELEGTGAVDYSRIERCLNDADVDSEHFWGWIYRDRLPTPHLISKVKLALHDYLEAAA